MTVEVVKDVKSKITEDELNNFDFYNIMEFDSNRAKNKYKSKFNFNDLALVRG